MLTTLIQGPLNKTSIENIDQYLKFGKVVVSHWDEDDLAILDNVDRNNPNIKIVSQHMPSTGEWEPTWNGDIGVSSTFPWAVKSTYLGLINVDTEYVLKTRSDESFENLQPLLDCFVGTRKFVTTNVFTRHWLRSPWNLGDHCFGCRTDMLIRAYDIILSDDRLRYPKECGESILCKAVLRARWDDETDIFSNNPDSIGQSHTEHAKQTIEIVDVNTLGNYVVCYRHRNARWDKNDYNKHDALAPPDAVDNTKEYFEDV